MFSKEERNLNLVQEKLSFQVRIIQNCRNKTKFQIIFTNKDFGRRGQLEIKMRTRRAPHHSPNQDSPPPAFCLLSVSLISTTLMNYEHTSFFQCCPSFYDLGLRQESANYSTLGKLQQSLWAKNGFYTFTFFSTFFKSCKGWRRKRRRKNMTESLCGL